MQRTWIVPVLSLTSVLSISVFNPSSSNAETGTIVPGLATIPGTVSARATFERIGFRWSIEGDEDLDCRVQVDYRPEVGGGPWIPAQDLLRVEPGSFNGDGVDPGNLLAGSIFGLSPETAYEVRLSLSDPDGGELVETTSVTTRTIPGDPISARVRHVVPGSGGGDGSIENPFRGIAAANASAEPGDLFLLEPGVYAGTAALSTCGLPDAPIVWRGTDRDQVRLDGEGTAKPVVDFSGSEYVHLENVTILRPRQMAVRGYETIGLVIRDCDIDVTERTGYEMGGIYLLGPGHCDALIERNRVRGPIAWIEGRIEDAYAVILVGTGHVVRYNEIYDWWDGLCIGGDNHLVETSDCDAYLNEIYNCTDDGIETDASRHNVAVWENRITNVLCGLSCQPVYGGPVYMIRNVIYNWQLKSLKFHVWPTGMIVYHNTFVGADPRGWGGGDWRNAKVRNNLFIGGRQSGPTGSPIPLETNGVRADLDYNGWFQESETRFAYFCGIFYPTLEQFQTGTGLEQHAVLLDIATFVDAEEPPLGSYLGQEGFFEPYPPGSQDLRLRDDSVAIDAAETLPNINDIQIGQAPDLGAYENGLPFPLYGPGAALPAGGPDRIDISEWVSVGPATPNPFDSMIRVDYQLSRLTHVGARVYDASGGLVRTLTEERSLAPGWHDLVWRGRNDHGREVASGVYFICIASEKQRIVRRVVLLRD